VRKVSGTRKPSKVNEAPFQRAVEEITRATEALLAAMETEAPSRTREQEAVRAKVRASKRYRQAG
jgi:hypothetical protein